MDKLAATVEQGGSGNKPIAMNVQAPQRGVGGVKFTYATGARPLDGYTIKRGVGIGGFGEVYYAVSDGGKEVAIKRIQRNLDIELRGVSQCLNLKHPNLLGLFDIRYDDQGQAWVIMEYVNGENLKEVIDRNPHGMPFEQVNRWFHDIARGVEYLHDHGIVHRDLKPGNIFMDQDIVKIGDYGLAKFISCSRRSGHTESVGTFHYMAPEIGKGNYGKEIDIYALGIILYEMLTGRVPFDGESSQEIIMKHLTADPDVSTLERPYRQAIQRALFKDPTKRYSSVSDMVQDLDFQWPDRLDRTYSPATPEIAFVPRVQPAVSQTVGTSEITFGPVKSAQGAATIPPHLGSTATQMALNEPILKSVRTGLVTLKQSWANAQLSPPLRVVIIVLGVLTLVFNSEWLLPLLLTVAATYLVYFGARTLMFGLGVLPSQPQQGSPQQGSPQQGARVHPSRTASSPRPARPTPDALPLATIVSEPVVAQPLDHAQPLSPLQAVSQATPVSRGTRVQQRKVNWRLAARTMLKSRSFSERSGELTGNMLLSVLVASVLTLIGMAIGGKSISASVQTWSFFAWMAFTTTIGTWLVLTVSKFWESTDRDGDDIRRRFVMLIAGLALGATAYSLREFLGVHVQDDVVLRSSRHTLVNLYESNGAPKLPAFLLYFGALFAAIRWWKMADPIRESRLSLWSTGLCVLLARVLHEFTPFYQPWGLITIGVISLAVQFSAPWISHAERSCLRQKVSEA